MLSVNALQIFSAALFMLVLPSIGGIPICTLTKTRCTMPSAFMLGLLSEFAFCQLLFVPLVLLRLSFTAASNVFLLFVIAMAFLGAYVIWKFPGQSRSVKELPVQVHKMQGEAPQSQPEKGEELQSQPEKGEALQSQPEKAEEQQSQTVQAEVPQGQKAKTHPSHGHQVHTHAPSKKWTFADVFVFAGMLALIVFILYNTIILQHTDNDDSRFVVNAVDMIRTNKLFLTDPATGASLSYWKGELAKDVTSPWAIYPACIARWTGIRAVAAFHSLIPVQVVILASAVYYALAERLFPGERTSKAMFVIFVWMVNLYGYYSLFCSETFLMTRGWQGKSIVAGVGIPAMLMLFLDIYRDITKRSSYVLLLLLNLAMCLLSGMGIIIGAILVASFTIVYAIDKKSFRLILWGLLVCMPNAVYYAIYTLIKASA